MRNAEIVERLVTGIMTGKLIEDFYHLGLVEISLTYEERETYLRAICDRYVNGGLFESGLDAELESLVCGHRPQRYRQLEQERVGAKRRGLKAEKLWGIF